MALKKIGVLTGGGDAPGLNAVIRAVVKSAANAGVDELRYRGEVVGSRRKMREESQAPRNSRELAVRNQFFTPRYVVQFLTDNTLGRIWFEMRKGQTRLADLCEYMVKPAEETKESREKKDPRDLRVLDPACGSGHRRPSYARSRYHRSAR